MNVRATVERLGREHVGKSWWADLSEALVREFEPVVAERDRLAEALEPLVDCQEHARYHLSDECEDCEQKWPCQQRLARAALDRGTP